MLNCKRKKKYLKIKIKIKMKKKTLKELNGVWISERYQFVEKGVLKWQNFIQGNKVKIKR